VEGSCKHGNEPSSSINCWEILEWLVASQKGTRPHGGQCHYMLLPVGSEYFSVGSKRSAAVCFAPPEHTHIAINYAGNWEPLNTPRGKETCQISYVKMKLQSFGDLQNECACNSLRTMVSKVYGSGNFFEIPEYVTYHYYPCSGVLQNLLVAPLVKASSAFFGTRKLIIKLTSAHHKSL
jgi:hypothetical protein